jgi:hypothetical protein
MAEFSIKTIFRNDTAERIVNTNTHVNSAMCNRKSGWQQRNMIQANEIKVIQDASANMIQEGL